jgi:hypothetical protein
MEAPVQTSTHAVLDHHLSAFVEAEISEILKDYTDESELLTPDGALKGVAAIQSFFEEVFKIFPKESKFEKKQVIVRDNIAYLAWMGESLYVSIPLGTDTFIFQNDKILYQTLAAQIIPKQKR